MLPPDLLEEERLDRLAEEQPVSLLQTFGFILGTYAFWAVVLGLAITLTCGR